MPKLLFLITEDWYFCSHRLPLARAAVDAGYDVSILTRIGTHREMIESAGIRVIPLELQRRSLNPLRELQALLSIINAYRAENPDIVHHVAMKPVLYGSIAASVVGISRVVNAFGGMGFLFSSGRILARILRPLVTTMFRFILNRGKSRLILQNPDDRALLLTARVIAPERIALIKGAGVDLTIFQESEEPDDDIVTVVLASRLLWDKGVGEFVQAAAILRGAGLSVKCVLVGDADRENPNSISDVTLQEWQQSGVVEWWGRRTDMPAVFSQAHIVCLPSYREGLPKVLLEAAACGRPIVTTDTPGCREIVKHGVNGLLVPVKNSAALADALRQLIENPALRKQMGARGREMVVREFAVEKVISETMAVYRELLAQ